MLVNKYFVKASVTVQSMEIRNPVRTINFIEFIEIKDVPENATGAFFAEKLMTPVQEAVVRALPNITGIAKEQVQIDNIMLLDSREVESETPVLKMQIGEA